MEQTPSQADPKRLESWKAIANYFNRSVRTVRRWEKHEGLPVHRHRHNKGSTVYAYRNELGAWQQRHHNQVDGDTDLPNEPEQSTSKPDQALSSWSPSIAACVVIMVVAAAAGALISWTVRDTIEPVTYAAKERVWTLVTEVDNRTDVDAFNSSLAEALRREVSNTKTHRNLPPERIDQALALMRTEPDAPLHKQLGMEVGLRDGAVGVLMAPRAEQLGGEYLLSVDLIDPGTGVPMASVSTQAGDFKDVIETFSRLAAKARKALDRLPPPSEFTPLPPVTTSSIPALRLYAQGQSALDRDHPVAARALLELALEKDPEFASAQTLLAWSARRDGGAVAEYLPLAEQAVQSLDDVSSRERYFIEGTYQHFARDFDAADASYSALLKLTPHYAMGVDAFLELCLDTKPSEDCVPCRERLAKLREDHFENNLQAAWALAESGQTKRAAPYAARAVDLVHSQGAELSPENTARALLFPVISAWLDGDLAVAVTESQRLQDQLSQWPRNVQDLIAEELGAVALALGQLQRADTLFDLVSDPTQRYELHALTLLAGKKKDQLREHLEAGVEFSDPHTAHMLSITGHLARAAALHDQLQSQGLSAAQASVIRGSLAFARGDLESAHAELSQTLDSLTAQDRGFYFIGPDLLATTLSAEGKSLEAVKVLESTSMRRGQAAYHGAGVYWVMCQHRLAELYREVGRDKDADQLESLLRETLRLADEDFPLRPAAAPTV